MEYEEFIRRVQQLAGLKTPAAAERAAGATIESIGEHLNGSGRRRLASQLPSELGGRIQGRRYFQDFDLDDFYIRVSNRADVTFPEAVKRSRAVVEVLREVVGEAGLREFLADSDGQMGELFGLPPDDVDRAEAQADE